MLADNELEPLVLADGTRIDPTTGKRIKEKLNTTKMVEVPSPSEAQEIVVKARRTVADLPMPPEQMTVVGVVAFYTLFGLDSNGVAIATGNKITAVQVDNIKQTDAYKDFMREARQTLLASDAENVRTILQKHSRRAAEKVVELIDSDNDVLSFKAAQDVLDRSGHRPADVVEHRHSMENALQIVVTKRDNKSDIPPLEGIYESI